MRITTIINDSTSYGTTPKDVILTTGASTEIGHHIFSDDLLHKLSKSKNDIVIAGGEPLDQFYPLVTFLECVRKKTKKKVYLVTKRKFLPNKRTWQYLSHLVDVVQEYTSGQRYDLPKSIKTRTFVILED